MPVISLLHQMGNQMNEIKIPLIVCFVPLPFFFPAQHGTSGLWAPDDDGCRSSSSSSSSSGRPVSAAAVGRRLPAVRLRIRRIPRPPPPRGFLPTLHFLRRGWKWKGAGALSFLPLLPPQQTLPSLPGGGISASKSPSSSSPIPASASAAREREAPATPTWSKIHQGLVTASSSKSISHQDLGYQTHLLNEVVISCPLDSFLCI